MRAGNGATDNRGFTLVEIFIALAIVGILTILAVSTFQGMNEKYKVESETKQMYADLMDARGRAMQRNRASFFRVGAGATSYRTYEDTSPAPDGNGSLDTAADAPIVSKSVDHAIESSGGLPSIDFNRNGIASASGTIPIRLVSAAQPDYDCITIQATRIKMGQYVGGVCVEK